MKRLRSAGCRGVQRSPRRQLHHDELHPGSHSRARSARRLQAARLDPEGVERHRIEGFLPADDFLAQLTLGLGHSAFAREDFAAAERWFREVVDRYPASEAAPEALYWAGVAHYKVTGDPAALVETAAQFTQRYQDTSWGKKASVWAAGEGVTSV